MVVVKSFACVIGLMVRQMHVYRPDPGPCGTHLLSTKASFQVDGSRGAELVRAKEMYQF